MSLSKAGPLYLAQGRDTSNRGPGMEQALGASLLSKLDFRRHMPPHLLGLNLHLPGPQLSSISRLDRNPQVQS